MYLSWCSLQENNAIFLRLGPKEVRDVLGIIDQVCPLFFIIFSLTTPKSRCSVACAEVASRVILLLISSAINRLRFIMIYLNINQSNRVSRQGLAFTRISIPFILNYSYSISVGYGPIRQCTFWQIRNLVNRFCEYIPRVSKFTAFTAALCNLQRSFVNLLPNRSCKNYNSPHRMSLKATSSQHTHLQSTRGGYRQ